MKLTRAFGAVPILLLLLPTLAVALPIQPPGLQVGDAYHWMFVTYGTHDGSSTDIDVYNDFVRAEAALNPGLTGTSAGLLWWAIASTPTVDAKDNAAVTGPVYLLDGTLFAGEPGDMWAPPTGTNILNTHAVPPNISQYGVERPPDADPLWPGVFVWTGTGLDGLAGVFGELGTPGDSGVGRFDSPLGSWISWGHLATFAHRPLYALSSPLKAELDTTAPVPEPGILLLVTTGMIGPAIWRRLSRA